MSVNTVDSGKVLTLLRQLSPREQLKVIAQVLPELERDLPEARKPLESLWGIFAEFGKAPGSEDIQEIRDEMWANFPRKDILS